MSRSGAAANLTIATPSNGIGQVLFADPQHSAAGAITYNHSTDSLSFNTAGIPSQLVLSNNGTVRCKGTMIIETGPVAIGTTSPWSWACQGLHVQDTNNLLTTVLVNNTLLGSSAGATVTCRANTGRDQAYLYSGVLSSNYNSAWGMMAGEAVFMTHLGVCGMNIGTMGSYDLKFYTSESSANVRMRIAANGKVMVGSGTPSEMLDVAGNVRCVSLTQTSDARFKRDVSSLSNAVETVRALNGVKFSWDQEQNADRGFDERRHIGLIAQDVEQILPEAVATAPDGCKSLDYNALIPVLIEAVKAQQGAIEAQKTEIEILKKSMRGN